MIPHKSYKKVKELRIFQNINDFKSLENKIEKFPKDKSNLKGDIFEIFVQGLIENEYNFNAKAVYPSLKQTPFKFRKKINIKTIIDKGIDGIIVTNDDEVIPYQAKYRSNTAADYGDTIKLEKQSKYAKQRYFFYNYKKITKEYFDDEKKNIAIGPDYLNNLDKDFFKRFNKWFNNFKVPKKERTPIDDYQEITVNKVLKEFNSKDRATITMACGSGKTLISFWIAEQLKSKNIIVFVPSKALLKQIRAEWLGQEFKNGLVEHISVFSEKEVLEYDEQIVNFTDVPFKVINSELDIKNFLNNKSNNTKVVFSTYQSSPLISKSIPNGFKFDFGVFDEAHKTTSNKIFKKKLKQKFSWNMPLQDNFIKIKKRLFMTATLKTSNFKKQNKLGYEQIVYSMKNEKQYGRIVDEFTFVKARNRGVICPIKVVISIVSNDELHYRNISKTAVNIDNQSVKTEQVAHQIAIKNAVSKFKTKKLFTFHSLCEDAESFTAKGSEGIKTHLPNFSCGYVDGKMSMQEREGIMQEFKNEENAIVSNARCLIEGVNIPTVDMVTFVSPKKSAVDIVQASGRAMRIRGVKNKKFGYILLPIFVEKFRGEKIGKAIKRTQFQVVLRFLKALSDYDESIKEEISDIVIKNFRDKGTIQKIKKRQKEKEERLIEFVGRSFDIEEIESSIKLKMINFFGLKFEEYFAKLLDFKSKYGHTKVPFKNKDIGPWAQKIRLAKRLNKLDSFRVKQLENIDFDWKIDGETIDSIKGLISEAQFNKNNVRTHLLRRHREYGYIESEGKYFWEAKLQHFYNEKKVLKKYKQWGVTINNKIADKLETINSLVKKTKVGRNHIKSLYNDKKIVAFGYYFGGPPKKNDPGVIPYFKYITRKKLLKILNLEEINTSKYIAENVVEKLPGLSSISSLRKNNKINYVRYFNKTSIGYFYKKEVIDNLLDKKKIFNKNEIKKNKVYSILEASRYLGISYNAIKQIFRKEKFNVLKDDSLIHDGYMNIYNNDKNGIPKKKLVASYFKKTLDNFKKKNKILKFSQKTMCVLSQIRKIPGLSGFDNLNNRRNKKNIPKSFVIFGDGKKIQGFNKCWWKKDIFEFFTKNYDISTLDITNYNTIHDFDKDYYNSIMHQIYNKTIYPCKKGYTGSGSQYLFCNDIKKKIDFNIKIGRGLKNKKISKCKECSKVKLKFHNNVFGF